MKTESDVYSESYDEDIPKPSQI